MSHDNVGCKTTMSKMNRRNVLLGLGTAAAGSGIVFGSGAFTQVAAEREVSVSVDADDAGDAVLTFDDERSGAVDVDTGEASITVGDVVDINQNSVAAVGVDVDDDELADAQQARDLDPLNDVEANGSLLVIEDEEDLDNLTLDRVEVSDPTDGETNAIDAPDDFEVVITEFDTDTDEPEGAPSGNTVRVAGNDERDNGGLPLSFEADTEGDSLAVGLLLVASDDANATDEFDADITLVVSADENGEE